MMPIFPAAPNGSPKKKRKRRRLSGANGTSPDVPSLTEWASQMYPIAGEVSPRISSPEKDAPVEKERKTKLRMVQRALDVGLSMASGLVGMVRNKRKGERPAGGGGAGSKRLKTAGAAQAQAAGSSAGSPAAQQAAVAGATELGPPVKPAPAPPRQDEPAKLPHQILAERLLQQQGTAAAAEVRPAHVAGKPAPKPPKGLGRGVDPRGGAAPTSMPLQGPQPRPEPQASTRGKEPAGSSSAPPAAPRAASAEDRREAKRHKPGADPRARDPSPAPARAPAAATSAFATASANACNRCATPPGSGKKKDLRGPNSKGGTPGVNSAGGRDKCDRCDGPHPSSACPHFRKARSNHPDAQPGQALRGLGASSGPPLMIRQGRVVGQPPDGSCLFHSLRFGLSRCSASLNVPANARALRAELARWVAAHPELRLADTPLASWVKWDSGLSPKAYASRMSHSGWGGGIELAACSHAFAVNVWVYEKRRHGYERISTFDAPAKGAAAAGAAASRTVHVLYQGGCHYDALLPEPSEVAAYLATARSTRSAPQSSRSATMREGVHSRDHSRDHTPRHQSASAPGTPHDARRPASAPEGSRYSGQRPWHSGGRGGKGRGKGGSPWRGSGSSGGRSGHGGWRRR